LKIKTFKTNSAEEMDKLVNDFEDSHNVKATQTHVLIDGTVFVYIATVFYVEDK